MSKYIPPQLRGLQQQQQQQPDKRTSSASTSAAPLLRPTSAATVTTVAAEDDELSQTRGNYDVGVTYFPNHHNSLRSGRGTGSINENLKREFAADEDEDENHHQQSRSQQQQPPPLHTYPLQGMQYLQQQQVHRGHDDSSVTTLVGSTPNLNTTNDDAAIASNSSVPQQIDVGSSNAEHSTVPIGSSSSSSNNIGSGTYKIVEVDSLVLIKVLKHCRDNYPTAVNGQLLGMDVGEVLEVTNCFPLLQKRDVYNALAAAANAVGAGSSAMKRATEKELEERVEEESEQYQERVAELMHDVNVDCFTVGWYQTLSFGDLRNKENIESLVLYQELVEKAVLLVFDPFFDAMGKDPFKGYRVAEAFLKAYREAEQDPALYNKFRSSDILEEVPISIKNPLLAQAFLAHWTSLDTSYLLSDFHALEDHHSHCQYLEKHLSFLADSFDDLFMEQEKLYKYHRDSLRLHIAQKQALEKRKAENEQRAFRGEPELPIEVDPNAHKRIPPPSQLNTLLMTNQASLHCKEISLVSKENLAKIFLLHKTQASRTH